MYFVASACQVAVTQKELLCKKMHYYFQFWFGTYADPSYFSQQNLPREKDSYDKKKEGQREFKYTRIGERLKIWHF